MLPNFLRPYHIDDQKLVRVGQKLDGGYVMDKKTILNTDIIITCGLNDYWEFEKFFLKINTKCKVEAYDHTIDKKFWIDINDTFVMYGQNICKPISPMCNVCKIKKNCKYYKTKNAS